MSKELEALERLRNTLLAEGYWQDVLQDVYIIEKSLKALEITKEKRVNVDNFLSRIKKDTDYKEYKRLCSLFKITIFNKEQLTQEEYNILKEVLL